MRGASNSEHAPIEDDNTPQQEVAAGPSNSRTLNTVATFIELQS